MMTVNMDVMKWLIWIYIFYILVDCVRMKEISVTACSGRDYTCSNFKLNCTVQHISIIGAEYRYNKIGYCLPNSCLNSNNCCSAENDDCKANYLYSHLQDLLRECDGKNWCGPMQSPTTPTLDYLRRCNGYKWPGFIHLTYTCIPPGKSVDENPSPAIIGVIISAIIVILVVAVALIILKRRQKKHTKEDTQISHFPKGLTNRAYESSTEASKISAVIETSNYDIINDEQELTYSLPGKKKKDTAKIPERTKKYDNVSAEEYDKIEFEMKGAIKSSSYDTLPTVQEKIVDDSYSNASIQIKSATTGRGAACEYSHCNLNSKDTLKNDDDYSHVDHEKDSKKNPEASSNEDDSYNHIDLDDNKHPMRNAKAVIGENEYE